MFCVCWRWYHIKRYESQVKYFAFKYFFSVLWVNIHKSVKLLIIYKSNSIYDSRPGGSTIYYLLRYRFHEMIPTKLSNSSNPCSYSFSLQFDMTLKNSNYYYYIEMWFIKDNSTTNRIKHLAYFCEIWLILNKSKLLSYLTDQILFLLFYFLSHLKMLNKIFEYMFCFTFFSPSLSSWVKLKMMQEFYFSPMNLIKESVQGGEIF